MTQDLDRPDRHIGYVLKRFPRISETFIAAELIELQRRGEKVSVFAISRPDEPFVHGFLSELNVPVTYLPHRPSRNLLRTLKGLTHAMVREPNGTIRALSEILQQPRVVALRRFAQSAVLAHEMNKAGVTHAHAHFASTAARLASLSRRMGGPSYSVTAHAKDIWHRDASPGSLRAKLGGASFVATVSRENKQLLTGILGDEPEVIVIPNSVDLTRLPDPRDRRPEPGVVLCVARLVEKKGLEDLIRGCATLQRSGVMVRLEVIGDGPRKEPLRALAKSEGLDVVWHGALPHEAVAKHYTRASVFALPCVIAETGDRDGLPTAVLEAIATGVPVTSTSVNGLAELVIDGFTGLVVDEHDPIGLAHTIGQLLNDPEFGNQLAEEARKLVKDRFSLQRSVGVLQNLFDLQHSASQPLGHSIVVSEPTLKVAAAPGRVLTPVSPAKREGHA